jgi:hypothetical protein
MNDSLMNTFQCILLKQARNTNENYFVTSSDVKTSLSLKWHSLSPKWLSTKWQRVVILISKVTVNKTVAAKVAVILKVVANMTLSSVVLRQLTGR